MRSVDRAQAPPVGPVRAVLVVALFALTAVGWRSLGEGGAGTVRHFHLPMLLIVLLGVGRLRLLRELETPAIAVATYTGVYVVVAAHHGSPPLALQQAVYFVAAFSVAATLRVASEADWRILRWTGPAALSLFVLVFASDAASAGVDAFATTITAVRAGDLNLLQFGLFQPAFNAQFGGAVVNSAALRGQIVAGLVVSVYLSCYATQRTPTSTRFRVLLAATAMATGLIAVLTLARFLLVALAAAGLAVGARSLLRQRMSAAVAAGGLTVLIGAAFAVVTPVAALVYQRFFDDTGSYEERGGSLSRAFSEIAGSPFIGTPGGGDLVAVTTGDRSALSAHNFVLDAALGGGAVTGLLAALVMILLFRDLAAGFVAYLRDSRLVAPVAAALLTPVAMFSAGSGTLAMPELLGLALMYGAIRPNAAVHVTGEPDQRARAMSARVVSSASA